MIQYGMSPVEEALYEYKQKMDKMLSHASLRCSSCDKLKRGVGFPFPGEFLCMECLLKKKAAELDSDPEYIRKERVYKLREARQKYNERCK